MPYFLGIWIWADGLWDWAGGVAPLAKGESTPKKKNKLRESSVSRARHRTNELKKFGCLLTASSTSEHLPLPKVNYCFMDTIEPSSFMSHFIHIIMDSLLLIMKAKVMKNVMCESLSQSLPS